jgi:hypothetical protein
MEYLYHRVPKNMEGTILYPLNMLKNTCPEIYADQVKKYIGREMLLTKEIPPLKCLWNDVLHFTAVSPEVLKTALKEAGIYYKMSFFKVPISIIEGENSIAFTQREDANSAKIINDYEIFDPKRIEIYRTIPLKTIEYYKQKKADGLLPLLYHLVPHVLYRGIIETEGLEIISV